MMLSIITSDITPGVVHAERRAFDIVTLSVVMLSVVMLSVVMLSVVMLNVVRRR
jgi:hypothetical protein